MPDANSAIAFNGTAIDDGDDFIITDNELGFRIAKTDTILVEGTLRLAPGSIVELTESTKEAINFGQDCNCPPSILATGREERIPKHGCDSTCIVFVLLCHYCVYNPAGGYQGEETKVCGACVGLPF